MIYKKGLLASEHLSPVSCNLVARRIIYLVLYKAWGVFWSNTSTDRPNSSVQLCSQKVCNTLALATLFINYLLRPLDAVLQPNAKRVSAVGRMPYVEHD